MRRVLRRAALVALLGTVLGGCARVGSPLVARFEVTPLVLYAGEEARFDASDSMGGIQNYVWAFGDGALAAGREVTHAFGEPGRYRVDLRVESSVGQSAETVREILVYLRSGAELFRENFSTGSSSLAAWTLDPSWASESEGYIENLNGPHGFVLHIRSGTERWHRRTAPVRLPPLRVGQRLVFSGAVRAAQNQDAHGFFLFPARALVESAHGSLPYFVYSSLEGGAIVCVPDGDREDRILVPFKPGVFLWHTYRFVYSAGGWELYVDDVRMGGGQLPTPLVAGGQALILLGDESHTEAVDACYDDLRMWIDE